MTLAFTLTYGSTTINLNSAAAHCELAENLYTPRIGAFSDEYVTESFEVIISDTTAALISAEIQAIDKALYQAGVYEKTRVGDRLYVNYQPDGYASSYRSEIINGQIRPDSSAISIITTSKKTRAVIAWTRRNFWEGAETQIPLSNQTDVNNTSGLPVFNSNDGAADATFPSYRHNNYADIAAGAVVGDLPAPVKLCLLNGGAVSVAKIFAFLNVFTNPSTLANWFESSASSIANTPDAARSGGGYSLLSVGAGATGGIYWEIAPAAQLFNGGYFRMLLSIGNWSGTLSAYKLRAYITDVVGKKYYAPLTKWTPALASNYYVVDLGAMRIPAVFQPGTVYGANIRVGVDLTNPTGGASTFRVDSLLAGPLDGMITSDAPGYSAAGATHVHLSYEEGYWGMNATVNETDVLVPLTGVNDHLKVYPGKAQRLYLRMGDTVNVDSPFFFYGVKMWYRPRRLAL